MTSDRIGKLSAEAPGGDYIVRPFCVSSKGPDENWVAFIHAEGSEDGPIVAVDEEPRLYDDSISPALEYLAALSNAYRSGELVSHPSDVLRAKPLDWVAHAFDDEEPYSHEAEGPQGWWKIDAEDAEAISLRFPNGEHVGLFSTVYAAKQAADRLNTDWLLSWMEVEMAELKQFDLVRFAHEKDGGPVHRIGSVMSDGMIQLQDMAGYFAPHLFVKADDIADIPLGGELVSRSGWRDGDEIELAARAMFEANGGKSKNHMLNEYQNEARDDQRMATYRKLAKAALDAVPWFDLSQRQKQILAEEGYAIGAGSLSHPLRGPEDVSRSRWRTDMENCPEGVRVLLWVPPYGHTTGHLGRDGRWNLHSVLNKDAKPTHWQHVFGPDTSQSLGGNHE